MKNNIKTIISFLVVSLVCSYSCNSSESSGLPNPQVKCGIAKVSGTIKYLSESKEDVKHTISVVNPITIKESEFEISVDENGYFQVDVPIEVSPTIVQVKSNISQIYGSFLATADKESKVEIIYGEDNNLISPIFFENQENWDPIFQEIADPSYTLDLSQDERLSIIKNSNTYITFLTDTKLKPTLKFIEKNNNISQSENIYLSDFAKTQIALTFLAYSPKRIYNNIDWEKEEAKKYVPKDLDLSYFVFLKDFDLSNPQYLFQIYYPQVLQTILVNKTLAIPRIEDTPIDKWLESIRERITNLVGFDKGLFYDVLIANTYALQFMNEMKPLSDIQIKNIKEYFKGGEIEKILLRKNEEIISLEKLWTPAVINETPAVPKEDIMKTIISKYRGNVVVVDYWATWCGPCLKGMEDTRQMKMNMKGKGVVFVYISAYSSPIDEWRMKIEEIGGEHYILNEDEWKYIANPFGYAIPTYQFYDKGGNLEGQITGTINVDTMRIRINELLKQY